MEETNTREQELDNFWASVIANENENTVNRLKASELRAKTFCIPQTKTEEPVVNPFESITTDEIKCLLEKRKAETTETMTD